ncbi:MAG: hypothetical protein H6Q20_1886 [Bacteroidetes bacterium]|nr:hypothetical protein [Bacteroidota bacterium]
MIKPGDTVRFLNAVGGGKVTRIDSKSGLVYVEDADGFEIPTMEKDCVVIGEVNEKTNFIKKDFSSKPASPDTASTNKSVSTANSAVSASIGAGQAVKSELVVEIPGGDELKAVLAFFPLDIKQLQTTAYDCYLVNDSNYFLYYNIVNGENNQLKSVANGIIEPNTQEELCSVTKEQLNEWEYLRVQLIPFKQNKSYQPQDVVDVSIRMNTVKFYKLHSFTDNDYFDEPAMIVDLMRELQHDKPAQISPVEIKEAMFAKEQPQSKVVLKKKAGFQKPGIIEVDLHIHELIDTTAGLLNSDMLQLQMEKFHAVLDEHKNNKGQKIVFIHGKGEGVLRKEIEKQLKTRYKSYYFQDASFREYGFGATMVTIK